jgi:hypothetical protein
MNNTNTGGPAFPLEYFDEQFSQARVMHGMTLRDYFAAKAMQSLIQVAPKLEKEAYAKAAYGLADAMLKAREA